VLLFLIKSHEKITVTDVALTGQVYAEMQFNMTVSRKPEWYILNVGMVSYMIVMASFSIFFIDEDSVANRLGIIFT
jgi:hypothetical protein